MKRLFLVICAMLAVTAIGQSLRRNAATTNAIPTATYLSNAHTNSSPSNVNMTNNTPPDAWMSLTCTNGVTYYVPLWKAH